MFADKIGESSTTTGTGPFSMGGAYGAFRTWRSGFADGEGAFYLATNDTGTIWEIGYGTFATGTPDTLSRTLLASSSGGLIDWQTTPYRVYSVPNAAAMKHLLAPLADGTRPPWLPSGGTWLDYALGYVSGAASTATAWVKKLYNGSADIEEGRAYMSAAIYAASQRALFVDKGAASYTFTADDIGKVLAFDCTAAVRVLTMLAHDATGMGHGAYVFVYPYGSASNGVTFTPGGADTTDLATAPPLRVTKFIWDGARSKWVADYVAPAVPPVFSGIRQTVSAGPVSTAGVPTFLPSTNAALSITTQNVSSSAPLVATAANGWSATTGHPVDTLGYSVANLTWSSLTAGRAAATPNFLYGTIAGGVITPASTILAPVYQWGGTPATTSGQITFNIAEMKAYLGNGSTAPQTNLVVFGEAATDGSGVISTVAYAYNGEYESAFTATLPTTSTAATSNHNIGVVPRRADFLIECTTIDNGYAVGDVILNPGSGSASSQPSPMSFTNKTVEQAAGSSSAFAALAKGGGGFNGLTVGSWKYKFFVARGW